MNRGKEGDEGDEPTGAGEGGRWRIGRERRRRGGGADGGRAGTLPFRYIFYIYLMCLDSAQPYKSIQTKPSRYSTILLNTKR